MKKILRRALLATTLNLAALANAATPAELADAMQHFQRASQGTGSEVGPAIEAFEKLVRAEPQNPVFAAYLGSAQAMRARDAWMPWNKIKYAEEGLDRLDQALAMATRQQDPQGARGVPPSLETKLVAATTFLRVPDNVFHRRAAGKKLVAEILASPAYAGAPAGFRASVEALK